MDKPIQKDLSKTKHINFYHNLKQVDYFVVILDHFFLDINNSHGKILVITLQMKNYYLFLNNHRLNKLLENNVYFFLPDAVMMVLMDQVLLNWMLNYCCYQKLMDVQILFHLDQ